MKKIIFNTFLFIICQVSVDAQEYPKLTKSQMYQDFDTLVCRIKQISPHIIPKKIAWNYDILKKVKAYRQEIDTINSYISFFELINKSLVTCQDGHTSTIKILPEIDRKTDSYRFEIPLRYINGKYYVIRPFQYQEQIIPFATVVTHINNKKIEKWNFDAIPHNHYDYVNKRFYNELFYYYDPFIINQKKFSLNFLKPDKEKVSLNINIKDTVKVFANNAQNKNEKRVSYWPSEKVIYIRVPSMNPNDIPFYEKNIRSTATNKEIKKIIIDIRNNSGGGDLVWKSIFKMILPAEITFPLKIVGNNPNYMSKDYCKMMNLNPKEMAKERYTFLENTTYYTISNKDDRIIPSAESIHFKSKIFVVGNESIYSSAGSAIRMANAYPNDSIISIGRSTGTYLGAGFSPYISVLANSKIEFRIAPSMDITGAKNARDIAHDRYEITIPFSLKQYEDRINYTGDIWGDDFLIRFDPFIKKALALE